MLRKSVLTLAALATLSAAALAPTSASATYYKPWHGYAKSYAYVPYFNCYKKKWIKTYYGWRLVKVNVCHY